MEPRSTPLPCVAVQLAGDKPRRPTTATATGVGARRSRHGHHRMRQPSSLDSSTPFWPKIKPQRAPHPRSRPSPCSPAAPPCPMAAVEALHRCCPPTSTVADAGEGERLDSPPLARAWASRRPRPSQRASPGHDLAPSPAACLQPRHTSPRSGFPRLFPASTKEGGMAIDWFKRKELIAYLEHTQ